MSSKRGIDFLDTMLEYYLGIDPHSLTDEEWSAKVAHLRQIRKMEGVSFKYEL